MSTTTYQEGDSLHVLQQYADGHFSSIVTDAPYGLGKEPDALKMLQDWCATGYHEVKGSKGFMGRTWDAFVPQPITWKEAYRVLKPGGYLLCFAGTRTYDLMTLALRIAGFVIQDCIRYNYDAAPVAPSWAFGSGFPKNANTQLKPGWEPIVVAYKPGGPRKLRIDDCRIPVSNDDPELDTNRKNPRMGATIGGNGKYGGGEVMTTSLNSEGRWPANIIHDGSDTVLAEFAAFGELKSGLKKKGTPYNHQNCRTMGASTGAVTRDYLADTGTAARFFYAAKSSPSDRNEGCEHLLWHRNPANPFGYDAIDQAAYDALPEKERATGNVHITVKPTALMSYLVRLITPAGGTCLDLFAGSGSTGKGAIREGINTVLIDICPEALLIAKARCAYEEKQLAKKPLTLF